VVANVLTKRQYLLVEAGALNSANLRENSGLPDSIQAQEQDNITYIKAGKHKYALSGLPLYNFDGELTRFMLICQKYPETQ
jgi:hypothetical protein